MYISSDALQDAVDPRLGVLYPSSSAEDDYERLAGRLGDVQIDLINTTIGEDAHREDALRDTGAIVRLLGPARELAGRGARSIMWACTSGSFVFGLEGAREQARVLETATGVPTSSTSLAFVAALQALGISRVALAATYPPDVTQMFVDLLADVHVEVVAATSLDILTGEAVGQIEHTRVLEFVQAADAPAAQAVLVPDTALHTVDVLDDLESALSKPVLTANQVTVWMGLRIAGGERRRTGAGALFERAVASVAGGSR